MISWKEKAIIFLILGIVIGSIAFALYFGCNAPPGPICLEETCSTSMVTFDGENWIPITNCTCIKYADK
jgi:hypothetical protein